jgi:hypothetical protein
MELETNQLIAEPLQARIDRGPFHSAGIDPEVYRIVRLARGSAFARVLMLAEYIDEEIEQTRDGTPHARVASLPAMTTRVAKRPSDPDTNRRYIT